MFVSMRVAVHILMVGGLLLGGCDRPGVEEQPPAVEQGVAHANAPEPTQDLPPAAPACTEQESGLVACPDAETMHAWALATHVREPDEATLQVALDPPDPVKIRDGLVVYDELLSGVARRTRSHLDLWANTPTYNDAEVGEFTSDPELWKAVVEFRAGNASTQRKTVRQALHAKDRRLLRALLLRDGVFYLEDPDVAAYAAKYVGLHNLFEDDELELQRGGLTYLLRRDDHGRYVHFDPVLDESRASVHMFDRVGIPGTLEPMLGYQLQALRRKQGLSHVVAGAETDAGRSAVVRFFDGEQLDGTLVLDKERQRRLAVVSDPANLKRIQEHNLADRATICGLLDITDLMVRERLDFDEPEVEYGQQDGLLRRRFEKAYAEGRTTYVVNGVTYRVFGKDNKPRVPQLCIDFVTDAVERLQGTWWAPEGEPQRDSNFDIRDYMPYRSVRSLVALGRSEPQVATVESLPQSDQIPYSRREDFFDNLWRRREEIREGDVIVIYGLRADNKNHYHSFYVRETDPVYGVPVVLTANPGFARIQAWHDVMWESPKRSIRHIVRWNLDWLRAPRAVAVAVGVLGRAEALAEAPPPPPP